MREAIERAALNNARRRQELNDFISRSQGSQTSRIGANLAGIFKRRQLDREMAELQPQLDALNRQRRSSLAEAIAQATGQPVESINQLPTESLQQITEGLIQQGLKPKERKVIKDVGGFNRYQDTGERVFPDAVPQPKTPLVNVNTGDKLDAFSSELQKPLAKDFLERRTGALDAVQSLKSSAEAEQLLDSGVITGIGANFLKNFGKVLQQGGFNVAENEIANTEAFVGQRAQEVGRIIKLFGAGTGLSDADRDFATKAAAGNIEMTEPSIRRLLKINKKASENVIKNFNKDASQVDPKASPFKLTVDAPSANIGEKPQGVDFIFDPISGEFQ